MITNNIQTKTTPSFSFDTLIRPTSTEDFIHKYWEKVPLIVHRRDREYYNALFSIDMVDRILDFNRPKGRSIRVVKNQEPLLVSKYENQNGSLNLNQLYAAYADGYTVVINEIERYWKPIKELCRNITHEISHHTVANMYLTPKNQKALLPHHDTHDVYVLQIHGEKHWKIYNAHMETPLLNSFQPIYGRELLNNPKEITLSAGDMMYMPRGIPHEAYTTDESSLHLTIGVYPSQWIDLITKSILQIAYSKKEFRQALPIGFLREENRTPECNGVLQAKLNSLLEIVTEEVNLGGAIDLLAEEQRNKQTPIGDGHFREIDNLNLIQSDTVLCKRNSLKAMVKITGSHARIIFPGNVIKGPAHIEDALQYISDRNEFTVRSIPQLSDENKVKLSRRLIRGGLLKIKN